MDFVDILGIAAALALDAFAVSIAASCLLVKISGRQYFRFSFHFGLFQFLMPLAGWLMGSRFVLILQAFDHWVALGLLGFVGGRMIVGSFGEQSSLPGNGDPTRGWPLVMLSVATSLDALAAGFSFALLEVDIWSSSLVIGLVAAGFTLIGMKLGCRLGQRFGKRMELSGGVILVGIGLKMVLDHTSWLA